MAVLTIQDVSRRSGLSAPTCAGTQSGGRGHPSDSGVLLAEWTSIDDGWWGARGRRLDVSPAFR